MKFFWILAGLIGLVIFYQPVSANLLGDHNIDTDNQGYQWAWNDLGGYINFHANNTIEVKGGEIRGWAESSLGAIVFNCATTPNGDICGANNGNFKVINNRGDLGGWAWNDGVGWISFDCDDLAICASTGNYRVTIVPAGDGLNSFFEGWAWSEIVGWISFSCENQGVCVSFPTYKIQTAAGSQATVAILESNVLDTGVETPAYNYILWQGAPKTGTSVQFQIATFSTLPANPTDWVFDSPVAANVNQRIPIAPIHQGKRYIKYRVLINSDNWQEDSPIIDDIIINWSP